MSSAPHQTEPNANNAMGSLLQNILARSSVRSENTQTITGYPDLRPDILITAPSCSPVAIETEYMPAPNAEAEANVGRYSSHIKYTPNQQTQTECATV